MAEQVGQLLTGGHQEFSPIIMRLAHLAQGGGNKLIGGDGQAGIDQYIEEARGLAELSYFLRGAEVNKAVDAGGGGGQVMAQPLALSMPHHHRHELAPQELEKLRVFLVDCRFAGFVPAAGDGLAIGLDAGSFGMGNNTVDIASLHQAAQRRQFVKLVALRRKLCGAGFDYLGYFVL